MEKELQELRERLSQVEQWKQRRKEVEEELGKVWTVNADADAGGVRKGRSEELAASDYHEAGVDDSK